MGVAEPPKKNKGISSRKDPRKPCTANSTTASHRRKDESSKKSKPKLSKTNHDNPKSCDQVSTGYGVSSIVIRSRHKSKVYKQDPKQDTKQQYANPKVSMNTEKVLRPKRDINIPPVIKPLKSYPQSWDQVTQCKGVNCRKRPMKYSSNGRSMPTPHQ